MTFTKEDAQDDGKIKEEVAGNLMRTARQGSPKVWDAFADVCDHMDQDPGYVLADMVVKALNNQEYADMVAETEVTMDAISTGDYRKEDLRMVHEIAEEFNLMPSEDDSENLIDRIINKRIESSAKSPLENFNQSREKDRDVQELKDRIDELQREVQRAESEGQKQSEAVPTESSTTETSSTAETDNKSTGRKDIDDLFGNEDNGDSGEDVSTESEEEESEPEEDEAEEDDDPIVSMNVSTEGPDEEENSDMEVPAGPEEDGTMDGGNMSAVPDIDVESAAGDVEGYEDDE